MTRVAIAGFLHETNTFAPTPTDYDAFGEVAAFPGFVRGEKILENPRFPVATGGFIAAARERGYTLFPIVWCFAEPSGHVTENAFERLTAEIVNAIATNGPFDAVHLDLHGAMVTRRFSDAEAEVLRRVRAVIGPDTPLVASLDLHGNIGTEMVKEASALVAYRTYPHIDMRETGVRACALLDRLLTTRQPFARAHRALSFLMPAHRQSTLTEPCRSIYSELEALERADPAIASLSFLPGFPLADIPMCAPTVLAYADNQDAADRAADRLTAFISAQEEAFVPHLLPADDAVALALASRSKRPVLLADVQDNAGAGGTADTMGVIEALLRANVPDAIVGIVNDPEAAAAAHRAGAGATLTLALGGKLVAGHAPLRASFVVEKLADGAFSLTGPMLGGFTANLGKVAQLRLNGVRIVVASRRVQCNDQAYFRHAGLEPSEHRIVVVKSTNHYRADFQPIADQIIEVAAPSVYDVNPANLPFLHLREGIRLHGKGPTFQRRP